MAATSTIPASPGPMPAKKQAATVRRATGKPTSCAARTLPPMVLTWKPKVVFFKSIQAKKQASNPKTIPGWRLVVPKEGSICLSFGIPDPCVNRLVKDGDRDVVEQQATDGLIDSPVLTQRADSPDPQPARRHARQCHCNLCDQGRGGFERQPHERGADAAHDQGAFIADDDQPEPERDSSAEGAQHQWRCAQQSVLDSIPVTERRPIDGAVNRDGVRTESGTEDTEGE